MSDILALAEEFRRELDQNFDDLKKRVTLLEMANQQRAFHEQRSTSLSVETILAEIERVAKRNAPPISSRAEHDVIWNRAIITMRAELIDAIRARAGLKP